MVAFGSVPLKTFLPDGDVDLTALSDSAVGDTLINNVRRILESEESNIDAELEVKDVKFIEAEVFMSFPYYFLICLNNTCFLCSHISYFPISFGEVVICMQVRLWLRL